MKQIDWAALQTKMAASFPTLAVCPTPDSENGIRSDEPLCATCRDAGYLRYDVPPSHENFGKLVACPTCGTHRQESYLAKVAARISAECGLGANQRALTFDSFSRYPGNEKALAAAQAFAGGGIEKGAWLVLQGKTTGTGKTHLLCAIANAAINRGVPTLYAFVTDLLDHLRAGYRKDDGDSDADAGGFEDRWERLKTVRLLLIDDFDMRADKPWVRERFEALFDARLRNALPTAITTNLVGNEWLRLSDRIKDRLDRYEPAAVVEMVCIKYRTWAAQEAARKAVEGIPF